MIPIRAWLQTYWNTDKSKLKPCEKQNPDVVLSTMKIKTPINWKTFLKSAVYRCYSSLVTFTTSFILTGNVALSASIGLVDSTFKIFTFYLFDVVWSKLTKKKYRKAVIFLTGLSGAGKTTIAALLMKKLQEIGEPVMMLDGDEIREIFKTTGFDKKSRDEHVKNVGRTAAFLQRRGTISIVSMIAPYSEVRKECRDMSTDFIEVHVSTPLRVCESRDVKGLYKKARTGEIKSFTGIHDDAPYEAPINAELTLETSKMSVKDCVEAILTELRKKP